MTIENTTTSINTDRARSRIAARYTARYTARNTARNTAKIVGSCGICIALVLAGCSVPSSETVQALPTADRGDLINGTTPKPTVPDVSDEPTRVGLYFVGANEELERVTRAFPNETFVADVLDALVRGPLPEEVADFPQLTSRITEDLAPTPVGRVDSTGRQTIEIRSEANLPSLVDQDPARALRIVSQIVCTVVNLNDITSVRLVDETDTPIAVLDAGAKLLEREVRASDFNDCKTGRDTIDEQLEAEQNGSTTTG